MPLGVKGIGLREVRKLGHPHTDGMDLLKRPVWGGGGNWFSLFIFWLFQWRGGKAPQLTSSTCSFQDRLCRSVEESTAVRQGGSAEEIVLVVYWRRGGTVRTTWKCGFQVGHGWFLVHIRQMTALHHDSPPAKGT